MKISNLSARQILDSKGHPTVEVEVTLENKVKALGQVPSGASTGSTEAFELRDNDKNNYFGKSVNKAVSNVNEKIKPALIGLDAYDQKNIDQTLIDLDGSENKKNLGANAILGCSAAVCRATARSKNIPLYQHFGQLSNNDNFKLPRPMILMLEGGKHGNWSTEIQEFMIMPAKDRFENFSELIRANCEVYHALEKILEEKKYSTGVGYEGAFAPQELTSNDEAFELILMAIEKAGYKPKEDFVLAIDAAASEFYSEYSYILKRQKKALTQSEWLEQVLAWVKQYPIWSLEDMFSETDWDSWVKLNYQIGKNHQIVGDDITTTNTHNISQAIEKQAINSVIIKPNQIGTISETIKAIDLAKQAGLSCVVSHRGGETNDDLIADLVVGTGCSQSKFGAITRGERVAKYNRLLRIEEQLKK